MNKGDRVNVGARRLSAGQVPVTAACTSGRTPSTSTSEETAMDEPVRVCIDADCPACGWPERWALLSGAAGPIFGCPKCDHTSERRDG